MSAVITTALLAGCLFKNDDDSKNNTPPPPPPPAPVFVGSITINKALAFPYGVSVSADNELMVTGEGDVTAGGPRQGLLFYAGATDTNFNETAVGGGQAYQSFRGHAVGPNGNIYVCSNTPGANPAAAVTVITKQAGGGYVSNGQLTFPNAVGTAPSATIFCDRLVIQNGFLFALNRNLAATTNVAVYALDLQSAPAANIFTPLRTYAELGFSAQQLGNNALVDMKASYTAPDSGATLWLLSNVGHQIIKLPVTADAARALTPGTTVSYGFDPAKLARAVSFLPIGDLDFLVSDTDNKAPNDYIHRLTYTAPGMYEMSKIEQTPVPVVDMALAKDRFGKTENPVVLGVLNQPLDKFFRIDEYDYMAAMPEQS